MNKNSIYIAIFAVLCTLAGVLVGASIAKKTGLPPWPGSNGPRFMEGPGQFIGGPRGPGDRMGVGLFGLLSNKLELNEKQKMQVGQIVENTRQEIDKLGENIHININEIKDKSNKQIMDILTPEQKNKFKELLKELEKGSCGFDGPQGRRGHRSGEEPPFSK